MGGRKGINGGLELALDVVNDSLVVGMGVVKLREAGSNGGIFQTSVTDELGECSEKIVVSSSDVGTRSVGTVVGPAGIVLGVAGANVCDKCIDGLRRGFIADESTKHELWLGVINFSLKVPHALIGFLRGGGSGAVLVTEIVEDGSTLVLLGAIVLDVRGEGAACSGVGACGLGGAPFFHGETDILELDTLVGEEVASGLGAALEGEVDKLGHCSKIWLIKKFINNIS